MPLPFGGSPSPRRRSGGGVSTLALTSQSGARGVDKPVVSAFANTTPAKRVPSGTTAGRAKFPDPLYVPRTALMLS
jgi:hypothetical protein